MDKLHTYKVLSLLLLNGTHYTPDTQVELTRTQATSLMARGVIEPVADPIPNAPTPPAAAKSGGKGKQQPNQVPTADTATETQGESA